MPEVFCCTCGKSIQISISRLARGQGRFCSRACKNKMTVSQNPVKGFSGQRATPSTQPWISLGEMPANGRFAKDGSENKMADDTGEAQGAKRLSGSAEERYLSAGFSLARCPWKEGKSILFGGAGGEKRFPDPAWGF